MPLLYTPEVFFEGFSLSRARLLGSDGQDAPGGEIYGIRSVAWEPDIESYDEFSHEQLINVWTDVRRVNLTMEAGYTSLNAWASMTGSSPRSGPLITNLLAHNQASGTDTLGTTEGFTATWNCSLSSSTAQFVSGSRSLLMTATATTSDIDASLTPVAVKAGREYTFVVSMRSGQATPRSMSMAVKWMDVGGATVETWYGINTASVSSAGWVHKIHTGTAPAGSESALIRLYTAGAFTAGHLYYWDNFGMWTGSGGQWSLPDEPVRGLTGSPANYQHRMPLWEQGRSNAMTMPLRVTFPAKSASGVEQSVDVTLFKVKFKPPKVSGASYKDGQSVTYEGTVLLSATDETGAVLDRPAFGWMDDSFSIG